MKPLIIALMLVATPAMAGEGGSKHEFRDMREALIRQMSPEGRYCMECHTRPRIKSHDTRPRIPPVPLPATALLFGGAFGGILIVKKWRKA
jgi:hypothetical protein